MPFVSQLDFSQELRLLVKFLCAGLHNDARLCNARIYRPVCSTVMG